jgi:hypothetical protein
VKRSKGSELLLLCGVVSPVIRVFRRDVVFDHPQQLVVRILAA